MSGGCVQKDFLTMKPAAKKLIVFLHEIIICIATMCWRRRLPMQNYNYSKPRYTLIFFNTLIYIYSEILNNFFIKKVSCFRFNGIIVRLNSMPDFFVWFPKRKFNTVFNSK